MNELVSSNITEPSPARDSVLSMLSHSDSKTLLILGGMFCLNRYHLCWMRKPLGK